MVVPSPKFCAVACKGSPLNATNYCRKKGNKSQPELTYCLTTLLTVPQRYLPSRNATYRPATLLIVPQRYLLPYDMYVLFYGVLF
jgi:hypothetical protein